MGAIEIGSLRGWRWVAVLAIGLAFFMAAPLSSQETEPKEDDSERVDQQGDPIPEKALVRMGTLRGRVPGGISAIVFSPDGKTIATGGIDDSAVRIWDVATGESRETLDGHQGGVRHLAFSSDGETITSIDGRSLRQWDVESGAIRSENDVGMAGPFGSVLALSPDGKTVAVSLTGIQGFPTGENPIFILKVESGGAFQALQGHEDAVTSGAFSRDGRILVSGGADNRIRVWDLRTSLETETIKGPAEAEPKEEDEEESERSPSGVGWVALSPDGEVIASASMPGTGDSAIRIWDASTGKELRQLTIGGAKTPGFNYSPNLMVFSGDGKRLACTGNDSSIRVWDVESGKVLMERGGYFGMVLAISPDGKTLAAGAGTIQILEASTGKRLNESEGHEGGIASIAFSPDGKNVVSGGLDETVRIWDRSTGTHLGHIEKIGGGSGRVKFASTGKYMVSAGRSSVRVWDVAREKVIIDLEADPISWIKCHQSYSPDFEALDREVRMGPSESKAVTTCAISRAGDQFAAGAADGTIRIWKLGSKKKPREIQGHRRAVIALAFSADGKALASWGADNTARTYKASSGKKRGESDTHGAGIHSLADFSPSLDRLAYGDRKGTIHIWDLEKGRESHEVKAHESRFTILRFSPDGRRLVTRGVNAPVAREDPFSPGPATNPANARIPIWDRDLATPLFSVKATPSWTGPSSPDEEEGMATAVAFSADGRWFASAGRDPRVRLWEVASGRPVLTLDGHEGEVTCLVFSPDGKTLASGSQDTTLLIWDLRPEGAPPEGEAEPIDDAERDELWESLAEDSAMKAYETIWRMAAAGEPTVAYLRERLKPIPRQVPQRARNLIRKLGHKDIDVREDAAQELKGMGPEVEGPLRKALEGRLSAETRDLMQSVLASFGPPDPDYPSESIRGQRAIQILEWIGTPEAMEVLRTLAKGSPWASQTRDAAAALDRLEGKR